MDILLQVFSSNFDKPKGHSAVIRLNVVSEQMVFVLNILQLENTALLPNGFRFSLITWTEFNKLEQKA